MCEARKSKYFRKYGICDVNVYLGYDSYHSYCCNIKEITDCATQLLVLMLNEAMKCPNLVAPSKTRSLTLAQPSHLVWFDESVPLYVRPATMHTPSDMSQHEMYLYSVILPQMPKLVQRKQMDVLNINRSEHY
ncbi:hypothetical protein C0J52_25368 [Blattella germanica]|nr:hypothetical protein C0J52_25368 [Blattella germanica]